MTHHDGKAGIPFLPLCIFSTRLIAIRPDDGVLAFTFLPTLL